MTKKHIFISQILLVLLSLTIYSVWRYPDLRTNIQETWRLSTTSVPETLTELYFENHLDLPKAISESGTTDFSFTIHNLENKSVEYAYLIYAKNENGEMVLSKDKVTIDHDQSKTVSVNIPVNDNIRTKIIIQLTGVSTQQIAFWMEARP